MISSSDLATLTIRRIIFHDVPTNRKAANNEPIYADTESELDRKRADVLKDRLARVIGSGAAYPVTFESETSSPVPPGVQAFTSRVRAENDFVEMSRLFARYLFEQQVGSVSPGLLCVIDMVSGASRGLAILKLERERGAELSLKEKNGKKLFAMSVLDNLVLTDGTRLFKSAMFIRKSQTHILSAACDSQRATTSSDDLARFWLRFLGCRFLEEPRVATHKWFTVTSQFINKSVSDPIEKNDIHEHLLSELKSNRPKVSPKKFIEEYLPKEYRKAYTDHLTANKLSLQSFQKDITDIQAKLKRKAFHTQRGVTITAPADSDDLVSVAATQIVVKDRLEEIS